MGDMGGQWLSSVDRIYNDHKSVYFPACQEKINMNMKFTHTVALTFFSFSFLICQMEKPGLFAGSQAELTLTAVEGVKVGHDTLAERPTGCTVILVEEGAVAGVDVRGGSPGTRETDLLNPVNTVQKVHAIVLAGGSAFGLDTATGVVRYLEENGIGFPTRAGPVPIVPAAILYDLWVGKGTARPDAASGYRAAQAANRGPVEEGSVGAGAGATVGKLGDPVLPMKSGVGSFALKMPDGLVVAALVVVNAAGDVIDPATGFVLAGSRGPDGKSLADVRHRIRSGFQANGAQGENTTLGVIATNAVLTQAEATKVAQMAHDGLARTIYPSHTPVDGDTIFALGMGGYEKETNLLVLGALAADVMAEAVLRGIREAEGLPGIPSAKDLKSDRE